MSIPQIDSYIFFDGNCAEAMRFYEKTIGGNIDMMMKYADAPEGACPPGSEERIMHASLDLDGRHLMASDSPKGQHERMQGFSVSLNYATAEEARRIFEALTAGGKTMMPPGPTFFAGYFGAGTDRFGTHWMVMGEPKNPSP
jgi:PhnB protein